MKVKEIITSYLGERLKNLFIEIDEIFFENIEEIRLRVNKKIIILKDTKEYYITENGQVTQDITKGILVSPKDILSTIDIMSNFSMYAFEEELKKGYITLTGGHRVGVTGKVITENNMVKTIRNINGLNIRISHQVKGCANGLMKYIYSDKNKESIENTLIISPPCCGKTTLLRDIIRQISGRNDSKGKNVAVVDERSEIAGCYLGIPQNDLGQRTDVLDSCPKHEGMIMILRSMSPQVIAVDEIGSIKDVEAIEDIINGGIKLICTIHGKNIEDLLKRDEIKSLLNKKVITRFIILEGKGIVKTILNENYLEIGEI